MDGYIKDVEKLNVKILLRGEEKQKQVFLEEFGEWGQSLPGVNSVQNGMERRENNRVMYGALMHTVAGMFMVKGLFAVLSLFDMRLIVGSSIGVSVLFAAVYGVSYLVTAKTYYRIVRQG